MQQLLRRYGVITREAVRGEGSPGGFAAIYPLLKAMEEAGRLRRGYFIAGFGATQFAAPGSETQLRQFRSMPAGNNGGKEALALLQILSATDPASPFGVCLPWPSGSVRPSRVCGSYVLLDQGRLVAYFGRGKRGMITFGSLAGAEGDELRARLAFTLQHWFEDGSERAWLLVTIDGKPASDSELAPYLREAGFLPGPRGLLKRRSPARLGRRPD